MNPHAARAGPTAETRCYYCTQPAEPPATGHAPACGRCWFTRTCPETHKADLRCASCGRYGHAVPPPYASALYPSSRDS